MSQALPTIDLHPFIHAPNSKAATRVVAELTAACHEPGFCYLRGHGVLPNLDKKLMAAARAFFDLPEFERQALAIGNSRHFRGYTILGDERTKGISDWRDQLDVGPEEPAPILEPGDPAWLNLRGPNQWPKSLPQMRSTTLAWMNAMAPVGLHVLRALAVGLGLSRDHFDSKMLPRGDTHVKIIRYPAQRETADTGQGVGLHHDSGLITFILQDHVGGLEVHSDTGVYAATHVPGCYIMNLGEMLQKSTGGYLRATKHRVQSPRPGTERISIAYFAHPKLEASFPPLELPPAIAALAKGAENPDPDDPIHEQFGANCLKIRLRAHPDVAERFYSSTVLS